MICNSSTFLPRYLMLSQHQISSTLWSLNIELVSTYLDVRKLGITLIRTQSDYFVVVTNGSINLRSKLWLVVSGFLYYTHPHNDWWVAVETPCDSKCQCRRTCYGNMLTKFTVIDLYPLYPRDIVPMWMTELRQLYINTYRDRFFINPP